VVDIRQAVQAALEFLRDIYREDELAKLGVEEVEHDAHAGHWLDPRHRRR